MKKGKSSLPSGFVAFMFTDIVNYSAMKRKMPGRFGDQREKAFLQKIKRPHDAIISNSVTAYGGKKVKNTGDGFLIVFTNLERAVVCGIEIQEKLRRRDIKTPLEGRPLKIRIGIHAGQ